VPEQTQLSYFDRRPDGRLGVGALPVTQEDLQPKLEDMLHTFGLLDRLSPALRDPPPLDIFFTGEQDHAIDIEVKLVRKMFPRATDSIVERLGRANWQRRLFLRSLRSRIRQERSSADQMAVTPGSNRQFSLASPEALPSRHRHFRPELPEHRRALLGRLNSRRTSFSDSTTDDIGFWSRAGSRVADTATSLTESDIQGSSQLSVPLPPVPLEDGANFRCQYCGLDIVVGETCAEIRQRWLAQRMTTTAQGRKVVLESSGKTARVGESNTPSKQEPNLALPTSLEVLTSADWVAHVFVDIEPYVCTSESCSSGSRTYGRAAEWLTHELDSHRLARIWHCQSCDQPFTRSEAFVGHLTSAHGLAADQALAVSSFCEKPAQSAPDLSCALCALSCSSFDSFRVHVAGHLEQLALCSIETDEKAESEIPTSPAVRPASADYARLEEFVFSQSKYYPSALLQEHQLVSMEKQKLNQNTTMEAEKIITVGKAKRPTIPGRGPSYSFLSDARQRKAREHGTAELAPATPSGSASHTPQTARTNSPPRNVDFVGRIGDMDNIHRQLSRLGNICVLSGIGGLGKSALAAEYTYRFEVDYAYIFWVQAETPMICADTFSQIAAAAATKEGLPLPSADEQRLVSLSQEFLEQTTDKWLLIFDNVDEKLDLRRFLPFDLTSATGSVLITTNRSSIALADTTFSLTQINLGNLTLEESRRLLLSATPGGSHFDPQAHPEYKLAGEIAKRAERLPLALSMIAGYVMGSHCTLAEFVGLWNERRKSIRSSSQSSKGPGSDTDEAMETLWDIGLREVPSDARKLLNILAFLDPDQIQKDLLVGLHEDPILELLHASEAFR
jgi:NB-ARC domain